MPEFRKSVCLYWVAKSERRDDIRANLFLLAKSVLGDGIKPEGKIRLLQLFDWELQSIAVLEVYLARRSDLPRYPDNKAERMIL